MEENIKKIYRSGNFKAKFKTTIFLLIVLAMVVRFFSFIISFIISGGSQGTGSDLIYLFLFIPGQRLYASALRDIGLSEKSEELPLQTDIQKKSFTAHNIVACSLVLIYVIFSFLILNAGDKGEEALGSFALFLFLGFMVFVQISITLLNLTTQKKWVLWLTNSISTLITAIPILFYFSIN